CIDPINSFHLIENDIHENDPDIILSCPADRDRAALGQDHLITLISQDIGECFSCQLIVIHYKKLQSLGHAEPLHAGSIGLGEIDREGRPLAGNAADDFDASAVIFYDQDSAEEEAQTDSLLLGRGERLEQLVPDLLGNTGAAVGDPDLDVIGLVAGLDEQTVALVGG